MKQDFKKKGKKKKKIRGNELQVVNSKFGNSTYLKVTSLNFKLVSFLQRTG